MCCILWLGQNSSGLYCCRLITGSLLLTEPNIAIVNLKQTLVLARPKKVSLQLICVSLVDMVLVVLTDVQCTQSPWTYGYPMNSPLVKTAKAEGPQSAFVFEMPLSKERDSFLPSPTSALARMMVSFSVNCSLTLYGSG